ncbi:hypothetical protein BRADI_1g29812v3 [Brachypodium distachyon]|uniref:SWIM-type domain-containing protein n=1 Tax=Brachypodium distachyon TaxID=15368 RepID=A0A0Q3JX63_BRADI|nr:hypothetical protein BRADI_1g29812v3 [Brachypodium distachyon]
MKVKLDGATYIMEQFEEEHNHSVLKKFDLGKYLRSHRHMPREEREFVKLLHACNLRTSQMMQILSTLHGKLNDLSYTRTDMANFRAAPRREHCVMDMKYTLRYFKKLKKEDDDFFYSFKLDEEDRVINLYWIDAEARRSYKYYSDCISFDTTYLTNKYNMTCTPFIGINNHCQLVQFGCGFLRNEDTLNFVWLFNTFLEAMDGIAPANIITDQDFAMRNTILEVFPETRHRNCRWHIMKKAQEKMEFELKWSAMIEKYQVQDNEDLSSLWENQTSWVPAYFMLSFYPFLQSVQRSEGFNAVLKRYVSPSNSIYDFAQQYSVLQEKILGAERQAEAETALTVPKKWGFSPIEEQNTFEAISMTGHSGQYGARTFRLAADIEAGMYSCECCKFDRDGIVCCHILRVMQQEGEMPENSRKLMRYATMKRGFGDIAKEACDDQDAVRIVERHMKAMRSEMASLRKRQEKDARAKEAIGLSRRQGVVPLGSASGAAQEGSTSGGGGGGRVCDKGCN